MRAILIDPFACTVTEIEYEHTSYRAIYPHLSHETMPVDCFDVVRLDDGDGIFVDDEGLLKEPKRLFALRGYPTPLAGKGLVLGSNDEGDTVDAKVSLEWVERNVLFLERSGRFLSATMTPWE